MKEILHFSSTKERLKYLSGGFEEIIPVEVTEKVEEKAEEVENEQIKSKDDEKTQKKTSKSKKKAKKVEEDGKVQAE